jgi:hypothetical protein
MCVRWQDYRRNEYANDIGTQRNEDETYDIQAAKKAAKMNANKHIEGTQTNS